MQWTSAPNIAGAPLPQRARSYWKAWIRALHEELEKFLERERAQLPPWFVVGFGTGIAAWHALGRPSEWAAFLCLAAGLVLVGFGLGRGRVGRALGWFALASLLGCLLIWGRADWLASPKREEFFGPLGITNIRTFVDPENRSRVGVLMDVPNMETLMAAMDAPDAAEAMEYDGVLPETLVILVES